MVGQHNFHCAVQLLIKRMLIAGALGVPVTVSDIWVILWPVVALCLCDWMR